jgi:hypothetical protein
MEYLIYKITNKIDNKIYIGKHKTDNKNDEYFGSGLILKRAIEKYGKEYFIKEILIECNSEEEMNDKERDIVNEEFVSRDDTYNIKVGGAGGFDYINDNGKNHNGQWKNSMKKRGEKNRSRFRWLLDNDEEFRNEFKQKCSERMKLYQSINGNPFSGKSHSEETKKKMRESKQGMFDGKKNPNFGNHWITNGIENKLVKKDIIPDGWKKGRI